MNPEEAGEPVWVKSKDIAACYRLSLGNEKTGIDPTHRLVDIG